MSIFLGTISWNNLEFTKNFVKSLKVIDEPYHLRIFDNASKDNNETLDYLKALKIDLRSESRLESYKYYHFDVNQGPSPCWNIFFSEFAQMDDCDIIYHCNNDILMTKTINKLSKFIRSHKFGMACPRMLPRDTDLSKLENIAKEATKDERIEEGLEGPLMGIPKWSFEAIGYFDETLAFSFEDMDWHQRCHKANLKTAVFHGSAVWHYGGASTAKNPIHQVAPEDNIYYKRFQKKHG